MSKRFILLTSTLSLVAASPFIAFAQPTFEGFGRALTNFRGILNTLSTVIIGLALIFFFWGLAKFILSAGDEEKAKEGKQIMLWGIIAFVIMIGIWGIINFLVGAFGFTNTNSPTVPNVPSV